jgi:hypothetical protein
MGLPPVFITPAIKYAKFSAVYRSAAWVRNALEQQRSRDRRQGSREIGNRKPKTTLRREETENRQNQRRGAASWAGRYPVQPLGSGENPLAAPLDSKETYKHPLQVLDISKAML